ncbi:hypothetical protein [Pseudochryseolinea flava]|uniref:Uncharacterized protein n=1 Tax=Pseudochryseolinea flava TaxID=2059302 RepID=A0A364Y7G5_9BACT|nr:hypothetical protein [Pseudochryseolinea flava]RAW02917.1 hypothetical protein DQQ10_02075 [Pseudochryseolinea flava]
MKKSKSNTSLPKKEAVEIRKDLQDSSTGKDLSYLNELPQMGGYEGVKAGAPPAKKSTDRNDERK